MISLVEKMAILRALVVLSFLFLTTSRGLVQEFCIANLSLPNTPTGYPCKDQAVVTSDDFYFRGLVAEGNITNDEDVVFTHTFVDQFPALNGLGLSFSKLDLGSHGMLSHLHPTASEVMVVMEGNMVGMFIADDGSQAYIKFFNKGNAMVFLQGLTHIVWNGGLTPAAALSSYSGQNPGLRLSQLVPIEVVPALKEVATFLGDAPAKKLKDIFSGIGEFSISI